MVTKTASRNYYEVLHVRRDAPLEIIRGSYRTLMQRMKHHPDLGGDAATAALINEAYAVLSNAEKRAEYDALLDVMTGVAAGISYTDNDADNDADAKPEPFEPSVRSPNETRVLDWSQQCVFCETPHGHGSRIEIEASCQNCESPLSAAERHRMESEGQRAIDRIGKRMRANYYTHWPQRRAYSGHMEDLSLNGLRLVTGRNLVEGQCIKIVSDVVHAVAQVSHTLYERRGWSRRCVAGVSFVTLRFGRSVGGFVSNRV